MRNTGNPTWDTKSVSGSFDLGFADRSSAQDSVRAFDSSVRPVSASRKDFAGLSAGSIGSADSVIGVQCEIRGDFELSGRVQINGKIEGEIASDGELIIGEQAEIKANIFGRVVTVFGRVVGDIKCDERLELHSGAHLTGNVLCPRVIIQDGVVFEGRCWMGEEQLIAEVKR